jgi:hypothetical protein
VSIDELIVQLAFSASGKDVRIFYAMVGTPSVKRIEYVGVSNALNPPTSAKVWYITKLEYDSDACPIRARSLSTQEVLDDRATFFP